MRKAGFIILFHAVLAAGCGNAPAAEGGAEGTEVKAVTEVRHAPVKITIEKALTYDQHTLEDTYAYGSGTRGFQWDKIREGLRVIDSVQLNRVVWGTLQNHGDENGPAARVRRWHRDEYARVADSLGVEQYQSIPLYAAGGDDAPVLYGHDGSWVRVVDDSREDSVRLAAVWLGGEWVVPRKYVKVLGDTVTFRRVVVVDRTNQNIATLEKVDNKWLVRSMNPATTGAHTPPYAQPTPLGIFVVQEKKPKMIYYNDGATTVGGFAPWASRFCNGAYTHGVPVNAPRTETIEWSPTLGTVPRSHMCVRNATSHARFIYDWAPAMGSLVMVIE